MHEPSLGCQDQIYGNFAFQLLIDDPFARTFADTIALSAQLQSLKDSSGQRYRHTGDAFLQIYRSEGVLGFYKGLLPSLFGVSHVAVQFPLYEQFKAWARE